MIKLKLLFYTVKYLKPIQIFHRLKRKFKKVHLDKNPQIKIRCPNHQFSRYELLASSFVTEDKFRFLNHEDSIGSWNDETQDKLWLYNLHYFDDLNAVGANERLNYHKYLIEKWIEENPPLQGNGWEPYPLSLRIVNWIKYFLTIGEPTESDWISLYQQSDAISQSLEYHLLGNHLFANAKALVFAGSYFIGSRSDCWLDIGLSILDKEIPEQILDDGANFELSPMYHNVILADMLDLYNLASTFDIPQLNERKSTWKLAIQKMLNWASFMSHPDGDVSFFNDSAMGISAKEASLSSYANVLGIDFHRNNRITEGTFFANLEYLSSSGYITITSPVFKSILDVAKIGPDYIPGHGHADTLSFELSLFGQRVFVNTGTGVYGLSEERLRQRKTAAHNTIEVNQQDSSEVWSGFRVARRAYPSKPIIEQDESSVIISCSHDGYNRLKDKVTHQRKWIFNENSIFIVDELQGKYQLARGHLHLHPDVTIESHNQKMINLRLDSGQLVSLECSYNIEVKESTWHPEFGLSIPNKKLMFEIKNGLSEFKIRF